MPTAERYRRHPRAWLATAGALLAGCFALMLVANTRESP